MKKLPPDIKQAVIDILSEQNYVLHHAYTGYSNGKYCYCLTGAIGAACGLNPALTDFNSGEITAVLANAAEVDYNEAWALLFEGAPDLTLVNDTTARMEDLIEYVQTNL